MNAIGATFLTIVCLLVLCARRRVALLAVVAGVLYITEVQTIQVGGFNFFAHRIIELVGFIRVVCRKEIRFKGFYRIEKFIFLLHAYVAVVYLLRSSEGQAYVIASNVDAILAYLVFRGLIADLDGFRWLLRKLLLLLVPYTILLLREAATGHNWFEIMGKLAQDGHWIRNGRPRCLGSFREPGLLGTLGASFLPLYIGLACDRATRKAGLLGIVISLLIVVVSNSGGPASCAIVAVAGWVAWRFRTRMQALRRSFVVIIGALAVVMKAPVWFLLARISAFTGGSGDHRAELIDRAVHFLPSWGFFGMRLELTKDWLPYYNEVTNSVDMTNWFIALGLNAGILAPIFLIVVIAMAFSRLGKAMEQLRLGAVTEPGAECLLWGLGVMLAVHVSNWLGIIYFDQFYMIWGLHLAAIVVASADIINRAQSAPAQTEDPAPIEPAHGSATVVFD